MRYWYFLLLFTSRIAFGQTFTVESIPNPKTLTNTFVSDPAHILNETTVTSINLLLDSLEKKSTAQVAVVVLPSIGEAEVFDFAQGLFKKWGIGQSGKDNGLLILFVSDKHKIRFHTGLGLEGVLPDITCKRIQRDFMVPYFKTNEINKGMLEGVKEVNKVLTSKNAIEEIYEAKENNNRFAYLTLGIIYGVITLIIFIVSLINKKFTFSATLPVLTIHIGWWCFLYIILPTFFFFYSYYMALPILTFLVMLYSLFILFFTERFIRIWFLSKPFISANRHHELYNFIMKQKGYWKAASYVFPLPVVGYYVTLVEMAKRYRNKPRNCKNCDAIAEKLSEQIEDIALNTGQQTEEKIGSVDYDVWKCVQCGSVETLQYINPKTKYKPCPNCSFISNYLVGKRTIKSATYNQEGSGEEEFNCLNCGNKTIVPFVIPVLSDSSTSSSSGSNSSSDSGSFGGGDSGGGGADSSW